MIDEGLASLTRALALHDPARTSCRPPIAALHAAAPRPEDTDWPQIASLYAALGAIARPSPVVDLNRAVAVAMADGPDAGLPIARSRWRTTSTATTCSTRRARTCCAALERSGRGRGGLPVAPSRWSPTTAERRFLERAGET